MTLTLVRHKGELKPFGRVLAMRLLLNDAVEELEAARQFSYERCLDCGPLDRCISRCIESAQQTKNGPNRLKEPLPTY